MSVTGPLTQILDVETETVPATDNGLTVMVVGEEVALQLLASVTVTV